MPERSRRLPATILVIFTRLGSMFSVEAVFDSKLSAAFEEGSKEVDPEA